MRMEGGVSKTLPVIFAKELAVHQTDVVNFIPRATAIRPLPLFWRCLSLPETPSRQLKYKNKDNTPNNCDITVIWGLFEIFLYEMVTSASSEWSVSLRQMFTESLMALIGSPSKSALTNYLWHYYLLGITELERLCEEPLFIIKSFNKLNSISGNTSRYISVKWKRKDISTHCPRDVCTSSVTSVEVAGHTQLRASMAYLNSSSHTTWSGKQNIPTHNLCVNNII